jgi:hypothetical protein
MFAVNINRKGCLAQAISIALALFVRWRQGLGTANPIQDPQSCGHNQAVQPI